jgi:glycosyltransferase involved in cell wall biosynthesis
MEESLLKKVSVIIPTYNGSRSIERCIQSVIRQDGAGHAFNLEIIIVDDRSTDTIRDILRQYPGIRFLQTREHTGGPNAGKNIGLQNASGDYIAFIDQDDEWLPSKLQCQVDAAEKSSVVFCDYQIKDTITGKCDIYSDSSGQVVRFKPNSLFLKILTCKYNLKKPLPYMSSLLIDKSLSHIRFEEHFGFCDFDYSLRLFENQRAAQICSPLFTRYVDSKNLSLDPYYRRTVYYYNCMTLESYEDRYPKEVQHAFPNINGTYARYFYKLGRMKKARRYFRKSRMNWKTLGYWITSYIGYNWVKNRFRVFGT